jgi:hypothetical protein
MACASAGGGPCGGVGSGAWAPAYDVVVDGEGRALAMGCDTFELSAVAFDAGAIPHPPPAATHAAMTNKAFFKPLIIRFSVFMRALDGKSRVDPVLLTALVVANVCVSHRCEFTGSFL